MSAQFRPRREFLLELSSEGEYVATTELERRTGIEATPEGVGRIRAALACLDSLDADELRDIHRDASMAEAAAQRGKVADVEVAAAELRLHAERRMGELMWNKAPISGLKAADIRDFKKLAKMPRAIFDRAVEYHCTERRSHTTRAVLLTSQRIGGTPTQYPWLTKSWDGVWMFTYRDARTKRECHGSAEGTMEQALQWRAELSGRVSAHTTRLLPVRGKDALDPALGAVRHARQYIGDAWSDLTPAQKEVLDGAYGALDDLAAAIIAATNVR